MTVNNFGDWKEGYEEAKKDIALLKTESEARRQLLERMTVQCEILTQKGEDLCVHYGNALVEIHDLKKQVKDARREVAHEILEFKKTHVEFEIWKHVREIEAQQ